MRQDCIPGTDIPKPKVQLSGKDGNPFQIIGRVTKALRKVGCPRPVVKDYRTKAMGGDYDNVLVTSMDFADVE